MRPSSIAIVGMAGRFPGARNVREFWENLRDGIESIRTLLDEELIAAGVSSEELSRPQYVKRAAVLDDVAMFDATFFGLSPRDAAIMDPQHRHFLECAWEALEDAAHPPRSFRGSIGVFAGSGMNSYLIHNLLANRELVRQAGLFQLKQTGNDKDVLATRASYQFDLRGPSINVQTACSTSLVAVHLACQSLLNFECDMALAGGVTIEVPHGQGYLYREGEILSRDGRCRSFDAASTGTVFGSGAGIVVLRRLEDALADRDAIRAVILGSAVNNDGARKVGYLAPSVEGQAEVINEALEFAGVSADDISYVEAHGTGTIVGDPIEIRALTQAFRRSTDRRGYCAVGSLKTNVGHLDAASGVAALIKTVLALEYAQLPASLHFQTPNPHIAFADSPFFVNDRLTDWPSSGLPRRAGVTSLGIGGTNAHAVLEEALPRLHSASVKPYYLLTASAKTQSAAKRASENLVAYLNEHSEVSLEDASFTCQLGRQAFAHRLAWVVGQTRDNAGARTIAESNQTVTGVAAPVAPQVAFLFSGQGSQYVDMGRELYEHEPVFRESLDACTERLLSPLGLDLRHVLYPAQTVRNASARQLNETWLTQPALFAVEYSLARWLMSLGIVPAAMVGHSIGEYVAACLAGVFSLEDALAVVAARGRLMFGCPAGAMLAVQLSEEAILLNGKLSLAAVNGLKQCVVSGRVAEILALQQDLAMQSVACQRLVTSHAFHSEMMDPILEEFEKRMRSITLHLPRIPYLSNVSGTWITEEEATDPAYWARHLRHTVRFSDCLAKLGRNPEQILIEIGPGNVLTSLARQEGGSGVKAFQSLPDSREAKGGLACALQMLGGLWTQGVNVNWETLHAAGSPRRVSLPTYPFEHKRFWIDPDTVEPAIVSAMTPHFESRKELAYYRRIWKAVPAAAVAARGNGGWMIFNDSTGLGDELAARLRAQGRHVVVVDAGSSYEQSGAGRYRIRPGEREDYDTLVADVRKAEEFPETIVHLWSLSPGDEKLLLDDALDCCFFSPLFLAQALAEDGGANIDVALVSANMQQVFDEPVSGPARAVLLGPAKVIPIELAGVTCRSIDVEIEADGIDQCAAMILHEMSAASESTTVAFRGGVRFVERLKSFNLTRFPEERRLDQNGVYLITGGLGGLGLAVAEHLASAFKARLVLVSRSAVPAGSEWEARLSDPSLTDAERKRIEKLVEIRSIAGGLLVLQGDVTDPVQMKHVVSLATDNFDRIDGLFHAAGVLDDGPLMLKTAGTAARVLDAKVRGTLVLDELFRDTPLHCFVLFSSISSIFPAAGQVDYAAANSFLDAFALTRKERVTVINWGAWRDVGMAARSSSAHPLLHERLLNTPPEIVYESTFSQKNEWVLAEHRLKTDGGLRALLPGTAYLEMASAAFSRGTQLRAVEFRDVFFLAPFVLDSQESRRARVQLRRDEDAGSLKGSFRFSLSSDNGARIEHASGSIAACLSRPTSSVDLTEIIDRCCVRTIVFDKQHRTGQERQLEFGPRWHSLRRLHIGKQEGVAEIDLDEQFAAEVARYRMHPALLDLATGVALYLTPGYQETGDIFLPISYKRLCLYNSLPARFFSHIRQARRTSNQSEVETFDITLVDERGQVLAEIEGFSMRRIEDPGLALMRKPEGRRRNDSADTRMVEVVSRPGINPADGVRALVRILSLQIPHAVIAVAHPLQQLDENNAAPSPTPSSSRGTLAGENVQSAIADWWQQMLGAERVGPDDDFFDLGGHSLIGVRFLAAVRKAYGVDLDLADLFEARTARRVAEVVSKSKRATREGGS